MGVAKWATVVASALFLTKIWGIINHNHNSLEEAMANHTIKIIVIQTKNTRPNCAGTFSSPDLAH
jgi:hypothetical protein